jgi:hypothetical protein
MSERERELERAPIRKPDKSDWPEGVRPIGLDELDGLGIDAEGHLYWHGKPVETRARLDLNWLQTIVAVVIAFGTVIGAAAAVAQGWAAYNEWACRVGWSAAACPPEPPPLPPPSSGR